MALHGWKEQQDHCQHIRQLLAAAVQRLQQNVLGRAFYSMKENAFIQKRARKVQGRHVEAHFSAFDGIFWPNISMPTATVILMTNALREPGMPNRAFLCINHYNEQDPQPNAMEISMYNPICNSSTILQLCLLADSVPFQRQGTGLCLQHMEGGNRKGSSGD